jgi:hypothetical protein
MSKTTLFSAAAVIALIIATYFVLFQNQNETQAPIVDPTCGPGYELVGEGCMTHDEACKLQGDNFFYDISEERCLPR